MTYTHQMNRHQVSNRSNYFFHFHCLNDVSIEKFKAFLAVLLISVAGTALAEDPTIVNPYGTFLEGDGVEVEMAQFKVKNKEGLYDVLLKISGANAFNAGIDGKTFKYHAVHGGTGIDYQRNGKNIMSVRQPYGNSWSTIEAYLDGKTISLTEDKRRSKEVLPLHLLTASKTSGK